jgi:hypothetical protein
MKIAKLFLLISCFVIHKINCTEPNKTFDCVQNLEIPLPSVLVRNLDAEATPREYFKEGHRLVNKELSDLPIGRYLYLITNQGSYWSPAIPNFNVDLSDESIPVVVSHRSLYNQLLSEHPDETTLKIYAAGEVRIAPMLDSASQRIPVIQTVNNKSNTFHGNESHLQFAITTLKSYGLNFEDGKTYPEDRSTVTKLKRPHYKNHVLAMMEIAEKASELRSGIEQIILEAAQKFPHPKIPGIPSLKAEELLYKATVYFSSSSASPNEHLRDICWELAYMFKRYYEDGTAYWVSKLNKPGRNKPLPLTLAELRAAWELFKQLHADGVIKLD